MNSGNNTQFTNSKYCIKCGNELRLESNFCDKCGTPNLNNDSYNTTKRMNYCITCGAKLEGNANFCIKCGTNLNQQPSQSYTPNRANSEDEVSGGLLLFSFLIPILGFICYFASKDDKPIAAKAYITYAIGGFFFALILGVLLIVGLAFDVI